MTLDKSALGVLALLIAHVPSVHAEPDMKWHVENPRSFAHFIGDVLTRRIEFELPRPYTLAREKLPTPTRVNGYLELTRVAVQSAHAGAAVRYTVDLTYQIVNSPTQPLLTSIPPLNLRWVGGGGSTGAAVDEWPLVVAPLSTEAIRDGLPALRVARTPRLIPTAGERRLLVGAVAAALGLLAYLAWQKWVASRGFSRPFAAAHRIVRGLAKEPFDADRRRTALRAVHRAFDTAMGARVFAPQLDEFIARHPHFRTARAAAMDFFAVSRAEFYGNDGSATDLAALVKWSADFKACESRCPKPPSRGRASYAVAD